MNLWRRFTTFWVMLAHLLRHPTHREVSVSRGVQLGRVFIPLRFEHRHCDTCGYLRSQEIE